MNHRSKQRGIKLTPSTKLDYTSRIGVIGIATPLVNGIYVVTPTNKPGSFSFPTVKYRPSQKPFSQIKDLAVEEFDLRSRAQVLSARFNCSLEQVVVDVSNQSHLSNVCTFFGAQIISVSREQMMEARYSGILLNSGNYLRLVDPDELPELLVNYQKSCLPEILENIEKFPAQSLRESDKVIACSRRKIYK